MKASEEMVLRPEPPSPPDPGVRREKERSGPGGEAAGRRFFRSKLHQLLDEHGARLEAAPVARDGRCTAVLSQVVLDGAGKTLFLRT